MTRLSSSGQITNRDLIFLECQEYSTWKDVPTLMLGGGKVAGLCSMTIEPTIVGGKEAKPS